MKISTYRFKLKLYKAFAKHPRLSFWSLYLGSAFYAFSLFWLARIGHGFFSIEYWAGLILACTCSQLLTSRIKKLFGR